MVATHFHLKCSGATAQRLPQTAKKHFGREWLQKALLKPDPTPDRDVEQL